MSVSSLSIATSSSLPLSNKISTHTNPSLECCSLNSIPSQFKSKPKPTLSLKIKTHFYSYYPSFSLLSPPLLSLSSSSTFDTVQVTEDENEEEEYENEEDYENEGEDEHEIESQSGDVGRLYVGNLPYAMTSSRLADVFAEAGRVLTVQIVYDRVTDRSRGFGFVTMGSVEEAKEAIRMFDGSQVGGRTVKVNFPEVPKGGEREVMGPKIRSSYQGFIDTPHKLYASNLSWTLTSQALREAFEDQPGLLSTKVIYDRDSGRSRGFGFITFSSTEQVESALDAMNGVELEGRPLLLKLAEQKASPSPLPRTSEREYGNDSDSS